MCGIVGYTGRQKAAPILLEGLKRLEYRGYDSAGLGIAQDGRLVVARKLGRVESLVREAARHGLTGTAGIGHTRWATHGGVTEANAHPHGSSDGRFVLVHNGVIENHEPVKTFLTGKGFTFQSETDTEVLCNLIASHYAGLPADSGGRAHAPVPRLTTRHSGTRYPFHCFAWWCNGSTGDFDSPSHGSNPCRAAN
jgi:glucosamine--fructose-6-phosphate aminotransferase (isomerizing)